MRLSECQWLKIVEMKNRKKQALAFLLYATDNATDILNWTVFGEYLSRRGDLEC